MISQRLLSSASLPNIAISRMILCSIGCSSSNEDIPGRKFRFKYYRAAGTSLIRVSILTFLFSLYFFEASASLCFLLSFFSSFFNSSVAVRYSALTLTTRITSCRQSDNFFLKSTVFFFLKSLVQFLAEFLLPKFH